MIRRPPRSTQSRSSAASDVYKRAAKGLEWDAVFLAGLSDGLMPISLAETDEAVAEERRLLYVGITRARVHLDLSFGRARNPGGRASRRRTRFLDGIWPNEPQVNRSV